MAKELRAVVHKKAGDHYVQKVYCPSCRARLMDICNSDLEYKAVLKGMGNRMAFDFAMKCPRCKGIVGISFERSRTPLMFLCRSKRLPRCAFYEPTPYRVVMLTEGIKM